MGALVLTPAEITQASAQDGTHGLMPKLVKSVFDFSLPEIYMDLSENAKLKAKAQTDEEFTPAKLKAAAKGAIKNFLTKKILANPTAVLPEVDVFIVADDEGNDHVLLVNVTNNNKQELLDQAAAATNGNGDGNHDEDTEVV